MSHIAPTAHSIHPLLARRWSPYTFSGDGVAAEDLQAVLEAARWAPSSYNEQPWRYIVAPREDRSRFDQAVSCLVEANQAWAREAGVLMFGCYRRNLSRNNKPNGSALHDLGAASMALCIEATARGLYVHQMGGIVADTVREVFQVPSDYEIQTGLALGHHAVGADQPAAWVQRDQSPRQRRNIQQFAFLADWPAD